jgi:hypothetical protein
MPAGRPTKYKVEYVEQAEKLCALGLTDVELANFFGVSEVTLNAWKAKHPEFLKSLRVGKDHADVRVERSLYHRAIGYNHPEDKIFNDNGKALVVPTTKHYPPDTTAAIFWLKNRKQAEWRDKQDHSHEHSGSIDATISPAAKVREMVKQIAERR